MYDALSVKTGVDICKIDRIKQVTIKFKEQFCTRIFTKLEEPFYSYKDENNNVCYNYSKIAKRFAIKEAFVKALGVGIGKEVSFLDVICLNDSKGAPYIEITEALIAFFTKNKLKLLSCSVSSSDDDGFAIASVVLLLQKIK